MNKKIIPLILALSLIFSGCSLLPTSGTQKFVYNSSENATVSKVNEKKFLRKFTSRGFQFVRYEDNTVATKFRISEFKKYGKVVKLLVIDGNQNYLICPPDFSTDEVKSAFGDDLTVLTQGVKNIYLAATACGADFRAINAIDSISYSSIKADDWYVEEIRDAMNSGQIKFAGKYSAPDYELLTSKNVPLAIESTMILHTPAVREKLIKLGIPVLTDYSSYESSAEARMEWVKVYGLITGHEQEAKDFFDKKYEEIRKVDDLEKTGKTCAFFSLDAEGNAVVRSSSDYIPEMIRAAGGEYIFSDIENPNKKSHSASVNVTFEEFYKTAKDADVLILNTTIEGGVSSLSALTDQNKLFNDFKAVQSGEVYETSDSLYQSVDKSAEVIMDLHRIFTDEQPEEFFTRLS
ncbi:MAG: ABC transporter substrate-binding protein [Lachnospiraceae bacterium]|nr:ABC transporter substrate-binding protein [Lachnospiraceae bacterium]